MHDMLIDGEIERRHFSSASEFERYLKEVRVPVILTHQMDQWPALRRWDLKHFAHTYGDVKLAVDVNLPDRGAVYDEPNNSHYKTMTMRDIVKLIEDPDAKACYTHQRPVHMFPGTDQEVRFQDIVPTQPGPPPSVNFWIGSKGTRSGLHFDRRDNLLAQMQGRKKILICPPTESARLYQFPRNIEKSRIDIENPDFSKYPRLRQCRFKQGMLQPGELLFIPRMWWHFVRSLEPALSVNYWFGPKAPAMEELSALRSAGSLAWMTLVRDFVWHGVMGNKHLATLHTGRPTGAQYYDQTLGWRFKR